MKRLLASAIMFCAMAVAASAATLDDAKARGKVLCGVNPGLQGFASKTADGA